MSEPTEFKPTPEQVEEVAKRVIEETRTTITWAMLHDRSRDDLRDCANWHLAELHRKTETLRSQLDHWKGRFESLADDALIALAGHCGTPEEGYKQAPHCLRGDLQRLIREHQTQLDALKAALSRVKNCNDFATAREYAEQALAQLSPK